MSTYSVANVQARLKALGYEPGPIDGIRGRRTIGAVKQFQRAHGLDDDGIVDPLSGAALFGTSRHEQQQIAGKPRSAFQDAMPWLVEARRLEKTREIAGKRHSSTIMGWARRLGIWYPDDETPWCGLFTAHCIGSQIPDEALPNNPLGARNWLKFGREVSAPVEGAIVVFWRGKRNGWQGHVGFVVGSDPAHVWVLGGNQSNQVNVRKFPRSRVLGYRWPLTAMKPGSEVAMSGGKSTDGNEA